MSFISGLYRIFYIPALLAVIFFAGGCSQKIKTAAPYKNIAIVYSYLEMADTAHYVRIEKAFSDQDKSSYSMAQVADSNFFRQLNVRIERFAYPVSGKWYDTIHLNLVDLDKEGYPKQQGIFFTSPNNAYKFTDRLDPNYLYRLVVTNLLTNETDSADAPVINDSDKNIFYIELIDFPNQTLEFSSTLPAHTLSIDITYGNPVANFAFEGLPTPAGVSEAIIRFNWVDSNNKTRALERHSFDYDLGYLLPVPAITGTSSAQFSYKVENIDLYLALFTAVGDAPTNIYRLLDRCDLIVYLSTSDFYTYSQTITTQNTGLTGTFSEPIASNIKGRDAIGLFTSRAMRSGPIYIDPTTVDSLMKYPLLQPAKIAGAFYK